ncbi:MAG: S8 family serine peptidase, partial [Polyangiaceae bacterium]
GRGARMTRPREPWEFPYEPVATPSWGGEAPLDVVVATAGSVDTDAIAGALAEFGTVAVEILVDQAPVHWLRARSRAVGFPRDVARVLRAAGVAVRYVAPATASDTTLPPILEVPAYPPARPSTWPASNRDGHADPDSPGDAWFLGAAGVEVDRTVCGTGAGVRVAVIDDDAADSERLDLERLVLVGVDRPSRASGHGALMVAWAAGARGDDSTGSPGVAPGASVRLYCIPKPGTDVVSLPQAIARATADGADVILCATYVESTTSPMLDDALQLASRSGRGGLGTIVVLPTGRETSSPGMSLHASLSLSLGDPASDSRVHCVGPSGRGGGWFTWRDSRGKLRPFANRGPAVRWLAPGDDLPFPSGARVRLFHAESSGASAVAAGVIALVLASNPDLHRSDVHAILARTCAPPSPIRAAAPPADPADLLPRGRDRDGHDAKCGYGKLRAASASGSARDPLAMALHAIGEDDAARRWLLRAGCPYSPELARWTVRALLARPDLEHAVRVVARHGRLVAGCPARAGSHGAGAVARQLGVVARELLVECDPPPAVRAELAALVAVLLRASDSSAADPTFDEPMLELCGELWPQPGASSVPAESLRA